VSDSRMEEKLGRIEQKLDTVLEDVAHIKVLDAVQNAQLAEHMRRSDALERKVDSIWQKALTIVSLLGGLTVLGKALLGG
jgi:hypothetical protein